MSAYYNCVKMARLQCSKIILSVFTCILISNAKITSTIFACESIESISIDMQKLMKIHYETIKIILCFVVLIVNNLSTLKQY